MPVLSNPARPNPEHVAEFVRQATLESGLLHLRNVAEFLVNPVPTRRDRLTDLTASDYFDDGWSRRPEFLLGGSKDRHDFVNSQLDRRLVLSSSVSLVPRTRTVPGGSGDRLSSSVLGSADKLRTG
jgi:hypothetical protein